MKGFEFFRIIYASSGLSIKPVLEITREIVSEIIGALGANGRGTLKELRIHFLGTGGGRFVMVTQRRRTAGIRLVYGESLNLHIDPGPGALIFSNWARLNPQRLDAVLVSHGHPDHYCDAEILIEAMSRGATRRRGLLAAPRSVLRGNEVCGPAISTYHQGLVERVAELSPGDEVQLGEVSIKTTRALHSDPDTVGFRIATEELGDVAYTSDTALFEGIEEYYRGVRFLILCTLRPRGAPLPFHLSVDDAVRLVEEVKPGCVFITHFGMRMLNVKPEKEAKEMEGELGIPTVAAEDGMQALIDERVEVRGRRKGALPRIIEA